jgi:TolB-like protein/class 3 adenylate cyclase/Tfp pilus assembly protein PilF
MPSDDVERRLAAILSADAVGYSRLMAEDEAATIQTIRSYRALIQTLVEEHRGRVVDAPGDNLLAEFPTALDSVSAAAEIQRVLSARNVSLPESRRMLFRIGIHMGDVSVEGGRVYGDGVNVAARLEGLAEPGGICVSGTVHEQVRRKLELAFADLGAQRIKNIPDAVRVYQVKLEGAGAAASSGGLHGRWIAAGVGLLVVATLGTAAWWLAIQPSESELTSESVAALTVPGFGGRPAIAVLPFDNLSGDPDQGYFADGIAEDLLTRLASWRSFPVIARNSSFVYRGQAVDMKQVSRELGARYIVEGSVRRQGERIRITAQLIDGSTGTHIWAERYDREYVNVFDLQDEITESIVAAINPALLGSESRRISSEDPSDLRAWELVLRAQSELFRLTRDGSQQARRLLQQAIELDPGQARAYAMLARTHFVDLWFQRSADPERSLAEGLRAAERAVALDASEPLGHAALGIAYAFTGRGDLVESELTRALELDPSSPLALTEWGSAVGQRGRAEEGIAAIERAIRLSPKDPLMWLRWDAMTYAAFGAEDHERVVDFAGRLTTSRPDFVYAYVMRAASEMGLGQEARARADVKRALELQPDLSLAFIRSVFISASDEYRARLLGALGKAGLPEG